MYFLSTSFEYQLSAYLCMCTSTYDTITHLLWQNIKRFNAAAFSQSVSQLQCDDFRRSLLNRSSSSLTLACHVYMETHVHNLITFTDIYAHTHTDTDNKNTCDIKTLTHTLKSHFHLRFSNKKYKKKRKKKQKFLLKFCLTFVAQCNCETGFLNFLCRPLIKIEIFIFNIYYQL